MNKIVHNANENQIETIAKMSKKLIEFATEDVGYVNKSEIRKLLFSDNTKRITLNRLKQLAQKYKWGLLEAIEEKIGMSYELYIKLYKNSSTRLGGKKEFSPSVARFINLITNIAEKFKKEIKLEVKIKNLQEIWNKGYLKLPAKSMSDIIKFLFEHNVFVIKANIIGISGLATGNYIVINENETKERQFWSIFHELLHIIKGNYGLRTIRSPEEKEHELEVATFFFKDIAPDFEQPLTYNDIRRIYKSIKKDYNLKVSEWSLIKWYKHKGLVIEDTLPKPIKKTKKRKTNRFHLKFPYLYYNIVDKHIKDDESFCELFGLSYYEIIGELEQGRNLRDYVREKYCYT